MPKEIAPRQEMPTMAPQVRAHCFQEVALGYTEDQALIEASRCLQCKKALCIDGCPVSIDIPAFIKLINEKDYSAALAKIMEKSSLPAVCGRVCPQESQCEAKCTLGKKHEPVAIGRLERFVADYCRERDILIPAKLPSPSGYKVAVVGSGPAGLACASELAQMGHSVTMMEALHVPGGVLVYGIPEFRLPKATVAYEVEGLKQKGVTILTNYVVGMLDTVEELLTEYDATFIGTGAGLPYFMDIPGEHYNGVYSANEFLTRANLMKGYDFPNQVTPIHLGKRVAVIGGGNVAMDAARTALRLGAEKVYILYRRTDKEMPARREEIEHAHEEGIEFTLLTSPVEIIADQEGFVKGLTCCRFCLGEPDASGRCAPVKLDNSEYLIEVETVIMAIGQGPNPLIADTTPELAVNRHGNITATEEGNTSIPGVFAGGDIVTGAATVILAMGAGKKAAASIDKYLRERT